MRTTTRTPGRNVIAALLITTGLAVGATACGSDDDTDDPATPTDTLDDMTGDTIIDDMTEDSVGG